MIGEYIHWSDVETLLNFIGVSCSAIRFVQPSIRSLVHHLRTETFTSLRGSPHMLMLAVESYFREEGRVTYYLYRSLDAYHEMAIATLRQWREWSAVILSAVRLAQLHDRYVEERTILFDGFSRSVSRISTTVGEDIRLGKIFYCPKNGKQAVRIDRMRLTHTVEYMPANGKLLLAQANAAIKTGRRASEQEVYLNALNNTGFPNLRAVCYYALSKTLKRRQATEYDLFRDVLLMNPKRAGDFIHIYSVRSKFATDFVQCCATYRGKTKDAPIAFYLYQNKTVHRASCLDQCKRLYKELKVIG